MSSVESIVVAGGVIHKWIECRLVNDANVEEVIKIWQASGWSYEKSERPTTFVPNTFVVYFSMMAHEDDEPMTPEEQEDEKRLTREKSRCSVM